MICPNCGSPAGKNYCPQCGQATHLHDETVAGMVAHFIGHYFHYESKFWQTIKTLWLNPGALTVAYRNKQRARYVPPMSLYIFVVVSYFVISSLVSHVYEYFHIGETGPGPTEQVAVREHKSNGPLVRTFGKRLDERIDYMEHHEEEFTNKVLKILPKVFFFMVPVFAAILALFFIGRKDLFFIDHVIFSFHLHTMLFFVLLLADLSITDNMTTIVLILGLAALAVYCIRAMMVAYHISWFRATVNTVITLSLNFLSFCILFFFAVLYFM